MYGILLSLEGLSGPEAAGANVCWIVPPIKGGGGCRGSVWSIQVCPPPCRPGEGELSAEQGSVSAAHRTQDFTRFSSLAQGVCAAPVASTGYVSRQAICSFSQCGEKFELFCCTCVQREHGTGDPGIWHTCSISKRGFEGLNTRVGFICASEGEVWFLVRCCEGHHETAVSGKEWVGFFDQLQWLVKKFKWLVLWLYLSLLQPYHWWQGEHHCSCSPMAAIQSVTIPC